MALERIKGINITRVRAGIIETWHTARKVTEGSVLSDKKMRNWECSAATADCDKLITVQM